MMNPIPPVPTPKPAAVPVSSDSRSGWRFEDTYGSLPEFFYARVKPTPVAAPALTVFNRPLAEKLGIDPDLGSKPEAALWFSGNEPAPGSTPLAQAYAGHQFGNFTMLGDGRAILLGEQVNPGGERFDIQLKGSGRTPFSRGGDGRAALGPMLREYLISEAMNALGLPTTRSLAVVTTGQPIRRETLLPGAILTRVAASHIRVGTFEYAAACGRPGALDAIANYTLHRHYPEIEDSENRHRDLFRSILERQARLIAQWQLIGFVHGVMNTDNMALSGETIDYGPCAFMESYEPATVFSSIDHHGRYAYGNQPRIANWNLARLAEAMLPLFHPDEEKAVEIAEAELERFPEVFNKSWASGMRAKLGLFTAEPDDLKLMDELLACMQQHKADFTNTFRDLGAQSSPDLPFYQTPEFVNWRARWLDRLNRQPEPVQQAISLMKRSNPAFIPRNQKVEEALIAAQSTGSLQAFDRILAIVQDPFNYERDEPEFSTPAGPETPPYQTFCGT